MEANQEKKISFYGKDSKNRVKIKHHNLIRFLGKSGFAKTQTSRGNFLWLKIQNNRVSEVFEADLSTFIKHHLVRQGEYEVLETFVQHNASYINTKKLNFLPDANLVDDMDSKDSSNFYFKDKIVKVSENGLETIAYEDFHAAIWENRIIDRNINLNLAAEDSDFYTFCFRICGEDAKKLERLKSILGYLLHRYKDPALNKAIILYDKNMNVSSQAEGGTGKSLMWNAIGQMREVVDYNGKESKKNNWFKNQLISLTTDLVVYDDVGKDFDFNDLFAILTGSIEVERKREHAFKIPYSRSPKILITANHYVKGSGGSSDRRRRCEFELENVYTDKSTPLMEFGKRFFDEWNADGWSRFDLFMMECVQTFLKEGLIDGDLEFEKGRRLDNLTSPYFVEAIETLVKIGEWVNQREFMEILQSDIPHLTPHTFTKWLKIYCDENDLVQDKKSTGSDYFFTILKREGDGKVQ